MLYVRRDKFRFAFVLLHLSKDQPLCFARHLLQASSPRFRYDKPPYQTPPPPSPLFLLQFFQKFVCDSIGTITSANDYFLAEGSTAWGFTTWVLIQNPTTTPSDVTITYMTPQGAKAQPSFTLPGNSRKTIKVNDMAGMANTDFCTQVHGAKPIIAERSMYWDNGTGEACHDSIGMDQAHTTFYLPDGQTSGGYETWTLVQNPNASAVSVEVSYLKAGGGVESLTDTIPANSRKTFKMADKIPSNRASIMITSRTPGKKIMVERAMYWNNKGAGTETIGGFSD